VEKFQEEYSKDRYLRTKLAEMKRQHKKEKKLPIEYNNLRLESANLEKEDDKFLLYLMDGKNLRLCIPEGLHQTFLEIAHDKHNHAGEIRTYDRLRQHYHMKKAHEGGARLCFAV
jgi:hypothetical protein